MRRILRRLWQDERGVSLAVIALMMTTLLSTLAFSLDLGLLYTARAEAQRAADAAALAGASAFLNPTAIFVEERAVEYATMHTIRGTPIDESEVRSDPDPGASTVTVTITRDAVPLWFAQLFGIGSKSVSASATASAVPANSASCVAPLAFDYDTFWGEDETQYWPSVDRVPVDITPEGEGGLYEFVRLDLPGSTGWENAPADCPSDRIFIDPEPDEFHTIPASDSRWADELIQEDPSTTWEDVQAGVKSPRVITIMLTTPNPTNPDGRVVADFLSFFVQGVDAANQFKVYGRFFAYAPGMGSDGSSKTALTLQLVR